LAYTTYAFLCVIVVAVLVKFESRSTVVRNFVALWIIVTIDMVGTGSCCGESRPCWWSSVWWLGEWICRWSRCSAHQRLCQQSVCTDLSPGNL